VVTGLDEISEDLRTVDNYTRLLQTKQQSLNQSLTESRGRAQQILNCRAMARQPSVEYQCISIRQEVTNTRLALDYLQVMSSELAGWIQQL